MNAELSAARSFMAEKVEPLRAENARYRSALERIATCTDGWECMRMEAREALAGVSATEVPVEVIEPAAAPEGVQQ